MSDTNDTTKQQELDDKQMEGVAGGRGKEEQHWTIQLENPSIAAVDQGLAGGSRKSDSNSFGVEEVTIAHEVIYREA